MREYNLMRILDLVSTICGKAILEMFQIKLVMWSIEFKIELGSIDWKGTIWWVWALLCAILVLYVKACIFFLFEITWWNVLPH